MPALIRRNSSPGIPSFSMAAIALKQRRSKQKKLQNSICSLSNSIT